MLCLSHSVLKDPYEESSPRSVKPCGTTGTSFSMSVLRTVSKFSGHSEVFGFYLYQGIVGLRTVNLDKWRWDFSALPSSNGNKLLFGRLLSSLLQNKIALNKF